MIGLNPDSHRSLSDQRLLYVLLTLFVATALLFVTFPTLLHDLLSSAYMPHFYCYLGNSLLAWTQLISDCMIGLAYLGISGTLIYLMNHAGKTLPFRGLFLAFGVFIIACGASHFLEAATVWDPVYVLEATVKVVTAVASITTAVMLPFAVPRVRALIQSAEASDARRALLEQALAERDKAQHELEKTNEVLENRIRERTAQIEAANKALEKEVLQRRRNEERLRLSEELFSTAFRSIPLPATISTEREGRYIDVNQAYLDLMGLERPSVLGRTASELGFWVDPQQRKAMVEGLRKEGRVIGFPAKIKGRDGALREVTVSADKVDIEGQPCVMAITEDVTETKRLQAQFQQAQKMEAIGRLAAGIAHDFNNLLGVITGRSEILLMKLDPNSPVAMNIAEIKTAAARAAHLTRQLLAFSRQQISSPRILDLNVVVNNVSTMLKRVVGEDITFSFHAEVPLGSIRADAGQIEQVLMNLVVNARDAMPMGGTITIETANCALDDSAIREHESLIPGKYVMLVVRDTGTGMDEKTKARIFEPFFTTKEPGKGTGLGLASVYGIMKQSGGYIWAYSEPGQGTTFKLYFPRVEAEKETVSVSSSSPELLGGSETILVVEDEAPLRAVTAETLRSAGYTVLESENAKKALEMVATYGDQIHLLLTDVVMPGMGGVELSQRLKSLRPDLKVVFVSGYGGDQLAQQLSGKAGENLIEKPFSIVTLLGKVRQTLQTQQR